jgi:hypothetical protein
MLTVQDQAELLDSIAEDQHLQRTAARTRRWA